MSFLNTRILVHNLCAPYLKPQMPNPNAIKLCKANYVLNPKKQKYRTMHLTNKLQIS